MKRWPQWSRATEDTGAATALAAILIAALVAVALTGVWIGAAVVARHRAQSAADLAALAAAAALASGPQVACGQAEALSAAMGASLRDCTIDDLDVVVTTTVTAGGRFGGQARATARAGP